MRWRWGRPDLCSRRGCNQEATLHRDRVPWCEQHDPGPTRRTWRYGRTNVVKVRSAEGTRLYGSNVPRPAFCPKSALLSALETT